jgi:hypothetical protein
MKDIYCKLGKPSTARNLWETGGARLQGLDFSSLGWKSEKFRKNLERDSKNNWYKFFSPPGETQALCLLCWVK